MNKFKNNKMKILKLIVSFLLICYLLKKIDIGEVIKTIREISFSVLFLCIFIYFISVCLNAIKWKVLLRECAVKQLLKTCFGAQFYSIVLPGQLFGEASKIAGIIKKNIPLERAATSVVMDKLTGLIGLIVVGTIGIYYSSIEVPLYIGIFLWVSAILFVIILFILQIPYMQNGINSILSYFGSKNIKVYKITTKLSEIIGMWVKYGKDKKVIIISICIGVVNQLIAAFQCYVMTSYFNCNITFWDICWCIAALSMILLLPISFGGLGLREASLMGLFTLFLIPSEQSIIISFVIFLSQAVSGLFGGFIILVDTMKQSNKRGNRK